MKVPLFFIPLIFIFSACNDTLTSHKENAKKAVPEKQSFFPVTSFIKGELYEIKNKGVNPLKYTTSNNHTDSVWLKLEELDGAVKEFLQPEIDSANLVSLFTETSFLDQSINAVTFTYEPSGLLPDSMKLKNWDVYIEPESGKVKRVYIVKEIDKTKILQLTWQSREWCKITTIITDKNGVSSVEKEEKITWYF
jgi:hypothetical protein